MVCGAGDGKIVEASGAKGEYETRRREPSTWTSRSTSPTLVPVELGMISSEAA
jgi:hypothetical protein